MNWVLPKSKKYDRIDKNSKRRRVMKKQFDEKSKGSTEEKNESDYAFKSVIKKDLTNRRTISVVSLILAVLSVLF